MTFGLRLNMSPTQTCRGVATGWTGVDVSTPLLPETIPEIDADPASFLRVGVGGSQRIRTAAAWL